MTPREIKDLLMASVLANDQPMSWPAVKEIIRKDMCIFNKAVKGNDPEVIQVGFGPKPCQARCGGPEVQVGEEAVWIRGIGTYHLSCWESL